MNVTKKDKSNQSEAARLYEMSSEKNRNLFLFYLATIAYILITVASTTDLDLLLSEKFLILPVLSVGIPLDIFYLCSSPLVLILHFSLLHNTTEHLKKIKQWEKEEEKKNRESISSHLMHPYIFDFAYLSPLGRLDNILIYAASFLLYFLAPFCLFNIQFRFSDYQSLFYSFWHFTCLSADLYLLILFFNADHNPSRRKLLFLNAAHSSNRKKPDPNDSTSVAAFFRFFKYIGKLLKYFMANPIKNTGKLLKYFIANPIKNTGKLLKYFMANPIKNTAKLLKYFMVNPIKNISKIYKEGKKRLVMIIVFFFLGFVNLWIVGMLQFDRSITLLEIPHEFARRIAMPLKITKLSNFTMPIGKLLDEFIIPKIAIPPGTKIQKQNLEDIKLIAIQNSTNETDAWEVHGENYDLSYRRLVFSDFSRSYMQKIVLKEVYLQGSNMSMAQMQGADMRSAQLQGADMSNTKLQGADMSSAQLQGADMFFANLQGTNIFRTNFQGADMSSAQFQSADMNNVQFQGANMSSAQFQSADMSNVQFQGADMSSAQFQSADMSNVQFQGANMSSAQFQSADMSNVQFQGADMSSAQLQGANMRNVQLQGANIRAAKFSGADIEKANFQGSFCREERYESFFDRINARIGKRGLEECDTTDKQLGVLDKDTANSIIESLRNNGNVSEEITDKIEENINKRIGKAPSMVGVEKGGLNIDEVCAIIENWPENIKYALEFKEIFASWLATEAGKESRLKGCSITIQVQNAPQPSERVDDAKEK